MISPALPHLVVDLLVLLLQLRVLLVHVMELAQSHLPLLAEKPFVFAPERVQDLDPLVFMLRESPKTVLLLSSEPLVLVDESNQNIASRLPEFRTQTCICSIPRLSPLHAALLAQSLASVKRGSEIE